MIPPWDRMILVGRIARSHGNRGNVVVNPETDFPDERFAVGQTLYIRRNEHTQPLVITAVRFHRNRPIIAIDGVESMSDAEALAGAELRVPEDALRALPDGTFYRHDLVGCRVTTVAGASLGTVTEVEGTLEGSRLVVGTGRDQHLIPLVSDICVRIDPAAREIVIDPLRYDPVGNHANWDVTADGRFVFIEPLAGGRLMMVFDWRPTRETASR